MILQTSFHTRRKPGFTLIEVLLVIGLVVLLAALVTPAWKGQIAIHELQSATAELRTFLKFARIKAIESGHTIAVDIAVGGSQIRAYRWQTRNSTSGIHPLSAETDGGDKAHASIFSVQEKEFPTNVRLSQFDEDTVSPRATDELDSDFNFELSNDDLSAQMIEWKTVVIFHPDGRGRDAAIRLNELSSSKSNIVHLRGITGTVRIERVNPKPGVVQEQFTSDPTNDLASE